MKAKLIFSFLLVSLSLSASSFAQGKGPDTDQPSYVDPFLSPELREAQDLGPSVERLAANLGPEALRVAKELEAQGAFHGHNKRADYIYVVARALANWAAYVVYLTQGQGVPLGDAMVLAEVGAALSAGFQILTPQYVRWVTKHGVFQLSERDAGFVETWLKEFSLQWLYIGIFHLHAYALGIDEHLMSWALVKTVLYSWIAEGSWSLIIAKATVRMRDKLKDRPRVAWNLGKASYLALAIVSSVLMVAGLNDSRGAEIAYYLMMVTGVGGYAAIERHEIKSWWGSKCKASLRKFRALTGLPRQN